MSYRGFTNYGDQKLIVNGLIVSGVQSVDTSTDFAVNPVYVAGIGVLKQQSNKQIVPSFSFDQIITDKDIIPSLVSGNSCISGLFKHKNNILSF